MRRRTSAVPLAFFLCLAAAGSIPAAAQVVPRSESIRYTSGDIPLAAELLMPDGSGPHPAAVIIQGSGRSDRSNPWARDVAEMLVQNGLAVLLTDKRGSGQSGGDWMVANFHDLANDALAGVALLRARPDIDASRVGLAGLSQGGWVAPLAAVQSDDVAFVIDLSGTSVSFVEQNTHEMAATARQAGLSEEGVAGVLALNRAAGRWLVTGEWEPYARARAHALTQPWAEIADGYPDSPDLAIWTFLKSVVTYDPMPYWTLVRQPVLVVYGENDERDNLPVDESVRRLEHAFRAAGKTNARVVVAPDVGHSLWIAADPYRFAPEVEAAVARFVEEYVDPGR